MLSFFGQWWGGREGFKKQSDGARLGLKDGSICRKDGGFVGGGDKAVRLEKGLS